MARRRKFKTPRNSVFRAKFFKYLTIAASTLGVVSSSAFAVAMAIDAGNENLIIDSVREYTASFSSEGSIITQKTYKRGEELMIPENPTHSMDGENNYFFIGWDTSGNGLPDYIPKHAYYDFNAEAVYFRTGKFDLDLLDLLNMDLEDLMKLLQDLNIDWEEFMKYFNLSLDDLLDLLKSTAILEYETVPGDSPYPVYFRSTSFGSFDYNKMAFNAPSFYDSQNINSINPLSFTSYKLQKLDEMGMLPDGFGFTEYDIKYNSVQEYYPIPECSYGDDLNERSDSDAHYEVKPANNELTAYSAYCPAFGYVIDLFKMIPLTGTVYRDEKNYYRYALENYTSVPSEYNDILNAIIDENDWYEDSNGNELWQVDSIASYISKNIACDMFGEEGELDVTSLANTSDKSKNADPVKDSLDTGIGSDYDISAVATLLFRKLNIPARLVKGYVGFQGSPLGNLITLYNQHYWCEIYVAGTGWMICDCMDVSSIAGVNPYEELDKQNTPLENKHVLDKIIVHGPASQDYRTYNIGDSFDKYFNEPGYDGYLTAYFKDGKTERLSFDAPGVEVTDFDSSKAATYNVTISYTYEGVTKEGKMAVIIKDNSKKLVRVEFKTTNIKDWYYDDQDFSTAGVEAKGIYEDETEEPIDLSDAVEYRSGYQKIRTGDEKFYTVKIGVYNALTDDITDDSLKSTTLQVRVYYKRVTDIIITHDLDKDEYYANEKFKEDGLEYEFDFYGGDSGPISTSRYTELDTPEPGEYTTSKPTDAQMKVPGTYYYRITYVNDKEKDTIVKEIPITVNNNPPKTLTFTGYKDEYFVGQPFDATEFKKNASATVTYDHTDPETISVDKITVTPPDLTSVGEKHVTVSYNNGIDPVVEKDVTINVKATSGVVNIKSFSIEDEAEITYDGKSHSNVTCSYDQPANLPYFLHAVVDMDVASPADNGADVDEHHITPIATVRILDDNDNDYSYAYNYTVGTGLEGITYYINPRSVTITLSPNGNSFSKNTPVSVRVDASGMAAGDTPYFIGTLTYSSIGTYYNYFKDGCYIQIRNSNGVDVTGCYDITYVFNEVVITD